MARVAMLRFWSEIRLSMSMLQLVTAMGCVMATLFSVRTAANLQDDKQFSYQLAAVGHDCSMISRNTEATGPSLTVVYSRFRK